MISWHNIEDKLVLASEAVLAEAARRYANERFYGLVIEIPQNWAFELHLNTEAGLAEAVSAFRKDSVGYERKSDSEIAAMLGRWYFQSWKYSCLSMKLTSDLDDLNIANYNTLEAVDDQGGGGEVRTQFLACASRAAQRIMRSSVLSHLSKNDDFSVRVADEDGLDFFTHEKIN